MNFLEIITNKTLLQQLKKILQIKMILKIKKNLQKKRNKAIKRKMIKIEENKLKFKEVYRFIFGINNFLICKPTRKIKRTKSCLN
jgi:hypothetical protein